MDKCKYCGSKNLATRQKSIHEELYCTDCGKHQKFVKQAHNVETGEVASESQQKYALSLMTKWKHKGLPMTARQAGAIIQAFKECQDG